MFDKLSDKMLSYISGVMYVIVLAVLPIAWQEGLLSGRTALIVLVIALAFSWKITCTYSRRFREYLFEPIEARKLSFATRKFFDDNTQVLEQLGFVALGDFQLLPDPEGLRSRFLLSPGEKGIAEIAERDVQLIVCFVSVASDGTFFESSSFKFKISPSTSKHLRFQSVHNLTLIEALAQHQQWVEQYGSEHEVEILSVSADHFQEVVKYGHRLAGHDLFEQGKMTNPPSPLGQEPGPIFGE